MKSISYYPSPFGTITLAADKSGEKLCGLWLPGQKRPDSMKLATNTEVQELPLFQSIKTWLTRYFTGEHLRISELPLAPEGSAFRQVVWRILEEIPYGEVATYGEVAKIAAKRIGKEKMSAQAVGGAVGHNPISIIIPCHRVVGAGGNLTGFGGGLDLKIKLLTLEGLDMHRFYLPKK